MKHLKILSAPFGIFILFFLLTVPAFLLSQTRAFIKGADGSVLDQVEESGGVFFENGIEKDAYQIFKDHGINYIRLKLWHNPAYPYNDLQHVMKMAKRIKALNLGFLLDFHYSDTWADPGNQQKPAAWSDLSFDVLSDSIYAYTKFVVIKLKDQGTLPDMVQIGNEISCGMLWPNGNVCDPDSPAQWNNLGTLIKKAIQGLDEAAGDQEVKTIIHFANGGNNGACRWFFDNINEQSISYDIIGLSYYPWWHGTTDALKNNLNDLSARYNKQVMVVEAGYPWTLAWNDNTNNLVGYQSQLHDGYPATVDGQKNFITDVIDIVKNTSGDRGAGYFYWSPEWISAPEWGSPWENVSLFDFDGEVLESIKAFEDASGIDNGIIYKPFKLEQAYPNPFNGKTTIDLQMRSSEEASLIISNIHGKIITTLFDGLLQSGEHQFKWCSNGYASGIYLLTFQSQGFTQTNKLIIR